MSRSSCTTGTMSILPGMVIASGLPKSHFMDRRDRRVSRSHTKPCALRICYSLNLEDSETTDALHAHCSQVLASYWKRDEDQDYLHGQFMTS